MEAKFIIIKNYIHGLASFLDDANIKWEQVKDQEIKIYYENPAELFNIGFEFGKFYCTVFD